MSPVTIEHVAVLGEKPPAASVVNSTGNGEPCTVIVPENADVRVDCVADLGDISCLGHEANGVGPDVTVNDDGVDDGIDIDLRVEVGAGSVEVRRG